VAVATVDLSVVVVVVGGEAACGRGGRKVKGERARAG
jgi:hypothetical protein